MLPIQQWYQRIEVVMCKGHSWPVRKISESVIGRTRLSVPPSTALLLRQTLTGQVRWFCERFGVFKKLGAGKFYGGIMLMKCAA